MRSKNAAKRGTSEFAPKGRRGCGAGPLPPCSIPLAFPLAGEAPDADALMMCPAGYSDRMGT